MLKEAKTKNKKAESYRWTLVLMLFKTAHVDTKNLGFMLNNSLDLSILQRTLVQHILLSTYPMLRYRVLLPMQRMSSY